MACFALTLYQPNTHCPCHAKVANCIRMVCRTYYRIKPTVECPKEAQALVSASAPDRISSQKRGSGLLIG
ncbi:Endoglucanase type C [Fusarium oxysporum f. sp. albedinis]|nr:Endoglucanase type C [Fusarium oxysporum f. sp. albedinis]